MVAGGLEQEKGTIDFYNSTLFASKWLPVTNDLRTISLDYDRLEFKKVKQPERMKHIIHKAVEWKQMLDDGSAESMSEIARIEGLTRARITQIMNLLKLPVEMQVFLLKLEDPKQVRIYSERKLRKSIASGYDFFSTTFISM